MRVPSASCNTSREMTAIFYAGLGETEIDRFERTLERLLDNLSRAARRAG